MEPRTHRNRNAQYNCPKQLNQRRGRNANVKAAVAEIGPKAENCSGTLGEHPQHIPKSATPIKTVQ